MIWDTYGNLGRVHASESVGGVAVVSGTLVNLSLADELGEREDSGGVEVALALDNFAGGDFLFKQNNVVIVPFLKPTGQKSC